MKKHEHKQISEHRVKNRLPEKKHRYIKKAFGVYENSAAEEMLKTLAQLGLVTQAHDTELFTLKYRHPSLNTRHHSLGKIFSIH